MYYACPYCGHFTNAKREIGVGTGIAAFFTGGRSLLAVPFYKVRCRHCGMPVKNAAFPNDKKIIILIIIGIILLICWNNREKPSPEEHHYSRYQ